MFNNINKKSKKNFLIDEHNNSLSFFDIHSYNLSIKKKSVIFFVAENKIDCLNLYLRLFFDKHLIHLIDKNLNKVFFIDLVKKFKPNFIVCKKIDNYNLEKHFFLLCSVGEFSIYYNKIHFLIY